MVFVPVYLPVPVSTNVWLPAVLMLTGRYCAAFPSSVTVKSVPKVRAAARGSVGTGVMNTEPLSKLYDASTPLTVQASV